MSLTLRTFLYLLGPSSSLPTSITRTQCLSSSIGMVAHTQLLCSLRTWLTLHLILLGPKHPWLWYRPNTPRFHRVDAKSKRPSRPS
ncbi:hypothetical protein EDD18DRAFT_1181960 [Armillaria luteobubalina]|uniref:Secreted protein n=1 Tax=Armillaria luteobubalina TaxID=153913 RepID=A0AA39UK27_9AGAR|nr:hypothetical protein EDD18DRAFT_1181960 [Armillaria luteobubalina]